MFYGGQDVPEEPAMARPLGIPIEAMRPLGTRTPVAQEAPATPVVDDVPPAGPGLADR